MSINPLQGDEVGRDLLRNSPTPHDPFATFRAGEVTGSAEVVLGQLGGGKSWAAMTRTVLLPTPGRRVVVLDSMPPAGVGEYEALVRRLNEGDGS